MAQRLMHARIAGNMEMAMTCHRKSGVALGILRMARLVAVALGCLLPRSAEAMLLPTGRAIGPFVHPSAEGLPAFPATPSGFSAQKCRNDPVDNSDPMGLESDFDLVNPAQVNWDSLGLMEITRPEQYAEAVEAYDEAQAATAKAMEDMAPDGLRKAAAVMVPIGLAVLHDLSQPRSKGAAARPGVGMPAPRKGPTHARPQRVSRGRPTPSPAATLVTTPSRCGAACDGHVDVFRVVEKPELDDILARGNRYHAPLRRSTPTGLPGKWFYPTASEALDTSEEWRSRSGADFFLTKARVPVDAIEEVHPGIDATVRMPRGKTGLWVPMERLERTDVEVLGR